MAGPWEKYANIDPQQPSAQDGPWSKYAAGGQPSPRDFGIDYTQSEPAVRMRINMLPESLRGEATQQWVQSQVAKARDQALLPNIPQPAANIPFAKEAVSGINAGLYSLSGGRIGRPYDEGLAYEREKVRQQHAATPVLSTVADIATGFALPVPAPAATVAGRIGQGIGVGAGYGALSGAAEGEPGVSGRLEGAAKGAGVGAAVGGVLAPLAEGVGMARRAFANQGAAGAAGRVAESLGEPVDAFADRIVAGGQPGNVATRRATLDILGEEMQTAGGDVATAQANALARIMREQGVSAATARQGIRDLTRVHEDSNLMMGEYPAVSESDAVLRGQRGGLVQPQNVNLDDLGRVRDSQTQGLVDYLANNGNAGSATAIRNAITERQEALAPAMRQTLGDIGPQVGNRPATIVDAADMIETARQAGRQAYAAAYNSPVNNRALLNYLPRILNAYEARAATRSGDANQAIMRAVDQFYLPLPTGQRVAMGSLQQLQDARGVIRGQIEAYRRQGRDDLVHAVQPIYDSMTRLMSHASPQWAQANRQWADMNFLRMGEELGDAFATRAGPQFREQLDQFGNLAPQAQDIVRIHFLQKLYDKLDNLGDAHSVSKLFTNDHARNMVRALFGDQAAVDFTRAVRDQKAAEISQRMLGNSATHRRGMTQRQMDAEMGLVAAVENANVKGARNAILDWVTQLLTERRNRPMAEMLTTLMSDTARVAQNINRMRTQQQRLNQLAQPPQWQNQAAAVAGSLSGRGMVGTDPNARRRGLAGPPPQ